jgi:site-specific DNA recombinase
VRLVVGDTSLTTDASRKAILKAIARARRWYEQITTGQTSSIAELAGVHGVSPRFIHMQMKLVQLSPHSIENMMNRPQALPLSLDDLLTEIPMNWREQSFGMAAKSA